MAPPAAPRVRPPSGGEGMHCTPSDGARPPGRTRSTATAGRKAGPPASAGAVGGEGMRRMPSDGVKGAAGGRSDTSAFTLDAIARTGRAPQTSRAARPALPHPGGPAPKAPPTGRAARPRVWPPSGGKACAACLPMGSRAPQAGAPTGAPSPLTPSPGGAQPPRQAGLRDRRSPTRVASRAADHAPPGWSVRPPLGWRNGGPGPVCARLDVWGAPPPRDPRASRLRVAGATPPAAVLTPMGGMRRMPLPPKGGGERRGRERWLLTCLRAGCRRPARSGAPRGRGSRGRRARRSGERCRPPRRERRSRGRRRSGCRERPPRLRGAESGR